MSGIYENIIETIGKTPLVKLGRIASGVTSEMYAKVEFFNPGGSVKDRPALLMIERAEKEGLLKPGGVIIEATAGNTGVGLAMVGAIKGYRTLFVMPDKMSADKVALLRAYGAEVVITPTNVPPDSPESYNGVADRLAREIPLAWRPSQFANPHNPEAHYLSTGPEIWEDTQGKIDVFVAGMGTGGTLSGTAKYLKEKNPDILVVGADPEGSILSGDSPKSYKVEGIGEDFIPKTFNRQVVDEMIRVSDRESFHTARLLARKEGILAGGSSGTALAAALKYARRLQTPKKIVVLFPDTGRNYLTKIFSDSWMKENGLWEGKDEKSISVGIILDQKKNFPGLVALGPEDNLEKAFGLLEEYQISQLPVIENGIPVGSLTESTLMKLLNDGISLGNQKIGSVMGRPMPVLDAETAFSEAYRLLLSGEGGIIIKRGGVPVGVITRTDLIHYQLRQKKGEMNEI